MGYDGILCFSQGASFGALLCLLQAEGKTKIDSPFYILASGFIPDLHRERFDRLRSEGGVEIPSLHVMGEQDTVIVCSRSRELAAQFQDCAVCVHPGGHYIPHAGVVKEAVLAFLRPRMEMLNAKLEMNGNGTE